MKKKQGLFFKIFIWQVLFWLFLLIFYYFFYLKFLFAGFFLFHIVSVSNFQSYLMQLQHQILPWLHFLLVGHAKVILGMSVCLQVLLAVVLQKPWPQAKNWKKILNNHSVLALASPLLMKSLCWFKKMKQMMREGQSNVETQCYWKIVMLVLVQNR